MPENKTLTDEEIVAFVETAVGAGVGFNDSKLAQEREELQKYYDGTLPLANSKGKSKFISQDIFDSVESLKANLIDAFTGANKRVAFKPTGADDILGAEVATTYSEFCIFEQNDGEGIYHDVLHNGLMFRNGVAKVYWEDAREESEETFEDVDEASLFGLLAEANVEAGEIKQDPETGLFNGTIIRMASESQVKIEVLPPEEFGLVENAKSLDDAKAKWHVTQQTLADLKAAGHSPTLIDRIPTSESSLTNLNEEKVTRFDQIEGIGLSRDDWQKSLTEVDVYETYIDLDMEQDGSTSLWKVTTSGSVLLDKEPVSDHPFIDFAALRRPHSFWGSNWASKVKDTQNAKTVLTRGILDHTVITNNPRWEVLNGTVMNAQELLDNRFGGIVNVKKQGGVLPLPQASLNPFVFQTIQLLDERKEDTTGVSKLAKGLNSDALQNQNSGAMVDQLVDLSHMRQKMIAKEFAKFVKALYLKVYKLVLENEEEDKVIQVSGAWVETTPSEWDERRDMTIDVALARGEEEKQADEYIQIDSFLSQSAGEMYKPENKYHAIRSALKRRGIKDVSAWITDPAQIEPPKPDPMLMKQIELEERKVAVEEAKVKLDAEKMANVEKLDVAALQNKLEDAAKKGDIDMAKLALALRVQAHKEEIDWAEVDILKSAEDIKGIASPDS
jgi:hypothetical protein